MKRQRGENLQKVIVYSIVINSLQIAAMLAIVLYMFLAPQGSVSTLLMLILLLLCATIVTIGAIMDIHSSMLSRRLVAEVSSQKEMLSSLEEMNNTLRAQRHDYLNHLQVVYSLIEMKEWDETQRYIDQVYGDISSISRKLKTACPAVNALLQVKLSTAEQAGIQLNTDIRSAWRGLSVPGWDMCKILANLIDNAMDALRDSAQEGEKIITVQLTESVDSYRFAVSNNGPMIPEALQASIFHAGMTTKSYGHGMGLAIVKETLAAYGGEIQVESSENSTCFSGSVPKEQPIKNLKPA